MEIKPFKNLDNEEMRKLYDFILDTRTFNHFRSRAEMCGAYGGTVFDSGNSHFSLWDQGDPIGALGAISKDASKRNEIFLVGVHCREDQKDKLALLLDRAFDYCAAYKDARYILGISRWRAFLEPVVLRNGFTAVYRLLILDYQGQGLQPAPRPGVRFEALSRENKRDFQAVHNEAFLRSPNGAMMEDEELDEILAEHADQPGLAGVCYQGEEAAGIYLLKVKDHTGWIEAIGVHPRHQGKGIGKMLLERSVGLLQSQAPTAPIRLTVMSSNTNAVRLYLNNGFALEKVESAWYERVHNKYTEGK